MAPWEAWNRGPWLRSNCRSFADEVYVVSGPLFLPEREKDGLRAHDRVFGSPPSVTRVPPIFSRSSSRSAGGVSYIGCFVLPNGKCDDDLSRWLVPLENLEAAAGLIPFPNALTDDAARDALAAAEARWCPRGSGLNWTRSRKCGPSSRDRSMRGPPSVASGRGKNARLLRL